MITEKTATTPNVKLLLIEFMALRQTERCHGDIGEIAVDILEGGLGRSYREAVKEVNWAIDLCRAAAEPNPFKDETDEEIAGEIVKRIAAKRQKERA